MKKASPKALHGPIHIIPGSHLDYGWAASPGECFAYITENIRMAIEDISGDSPDYKFTIEYALFMKQTAGEPEYLARQFCTGQIRFPGIPQHLFFPAYRIEKLQ